MHAREMKQISDAVLAKDVMTNIELAAKSGKYEYMWNTTATHDNLSIYSYLDTLGYKMLKLTGGYKISWKDA